MSLAAVVAGVAARAIPEKVGALSSMNSGVVGYGLNFLSGALVAWLLAKTPLGANGGIGGLVGAITMTGGRIVSDKWGKTVVTFNLPQGQGTGAAAVPATMSGMGRFGDPSFNLGKYVKPYNFPLPNDGRRSMVPVLPAAPGSKMPAARGGKPLSRYSQVM
jgi:hypothetical protein